VRFYPHPPSSLFQGERIVPLKENHVAIDGTSVERNRPDLMPPIASYSCVNNTNDYVCISWIARFDHNFRLMRGSVPISMELMIREYMSSSKRFSSVFRKETCLDASLICKGRCECIIFFFLDGVHYILCRGRITSFFFMHIDLS
jgi:hypothetical protein